MPDGTLSDIEQRVARDRAALAASLDQLSDTLSPDRLKAEARDTLDRLGRDFGGQIWDATRQNPAAFALVGAGLALLLSDASRRPDDDAARERRTQHLAEAPDGFDAHRGTADDMTRLAPSDCAPETPRAARMRAALGHGLDRLPPATRQRVLDARLAAIRAQDAVERRARRMTRQTEAVIQDQPIVSGAVAFGAGVLAASLLPGTRQEDALLGRQRDIAMRAARTALEREIDALRIAGRATSSRAAPGVPS
jgi:hypothetical protein